MATEHPHPASCPGNCEWVVVVVVVNGTYWKVPSSRHFSAVTSLSTYSFLFDEKGKATQISAGVERRDRYNQKATGKERGRLRGWYLLEARQLLV